VNIPTLVEQDPVLAEISRRYQGARTADERGILAAADAIAERRQVVSLAHLVRFSAYTLPKIAVAPAWARVVRCRVYFGGRRRGNVRLHARRGFRRWSVTVTGALHNLPDRRFAKTIVPPVPPAYREEAGPGTLVAWEVERWTMRAPRDPALLHPIDPKSSDDFYEVGPAWELSGLERAALDG
jgi:hypothetical protein